MAKKLQKTNAMRLLDARKIGYTTYEYPHGETALPAKKWRSWSAKRRSWYIKRW